MSVERDIGELQARMKNVEAQCISMDGKLDVLLTVNASQKGGWKVLAILGGIASAALAAVVSWFKP